MAIIKYTTPLEPYEFGERRAKFYYKQAWHEAVLQITRYSQGIFRKSTVSQEIRYYYESYYHILCYAVDAVPMNAGTDGFAFRLYQNGDKVDTSVGIYAPEGWFEKKLDLDDFDANMDGKSDYIGTQIAIDGFFDLNTEEPFRFEEEFREELLPPLQFQLLKAPNFSDDIDAVGIEFEVPEGKLIRDGGYYGSTSLWGDIMEDLRISISIDGEEDITRKLIWLEETKPETYAYNTILNKADLYTEHTLKYNIKFTPEEKQKLINGVKNGSSKEITYKLITEPLSSFGSINLEAYSSELKRTFTLIDAQPILNPIVEDGNTKTLELTGDKNTFIKYHSKASYAINAETKKNATISHQQCSCGSKYNTAPTGTIAGVESGTFVFTVADSRDLIASQVIEKPLVPYVHLTANIQKNSATPDGTMIFTVSGNYYNGSFGAYDNNLIVRYGYRSTDDEIFQDLAIVAPSKVEINGNTYKATITVNGLDYRKDYLITVNVLDLLENITTPETYIGFTPIFDWGKNDFNFRIPVAYTEGDKSYSISDVAKSFDETGLGNSELKKLSKLLNVFTNRYDVSCEVYAGANYSNATVRMFLYGNMMYCRLEATRNSNAGSGDVNNEIVCSVEFDTDRKVIGFAEMSFVNGQTGALASFEMKDSVIYKNDGSVSEDMVGNCFFNIYLTATDIGSNKFSAGFCFPCLLDLN